MKTIFRFLPNFKLTYLIVGCSDMLLSGSLFMRGLMPSLAEFHVPPNLLASPHYYDAMLWVYVHLFVLGSVIACVGLSADSVLPLLRKRLTVVLTAAHVYYTYLDFRSSDSAFGNGLYQGTASVVPGIITMVITLLFLQLAIRLYISGEAISEQTVS